MKETNEWLIGLEKARRKPVETVSLDDTRRLNRLRVIAFDDGGRRLLDCFAEIDEMGLMLDAKSSVQSSAHAAAECRDRAIAFEKARDELIGAVRAIKGLVAMKAESAKSQMDQARPAELPELKGELGAYDDVLSLLESLEGRMRP